MKQKDFKQIRKIVIELEKTIMDNYKSDTDFVRLIDSVIYSNYSFFNSLLIDYQYPFFLELNTKEKYNQQGIKILDNAKKVNILYPVNDIYVKITDKNQEQIKSITKLTKEELKKYYDKENYSVTTHHKNLKKLNIAELYDCKDTSMKKEKYKKPSLPPLFHSDYKSIYNPFVKAIYADGYKVSYINDLNQKFCFDHNTKTIQINSNLNYKMKMVCLLEAYSSNVTENEFDKGLLNYTINTALGIEDSFLDNYSLLDWYKKTDIEDVEHSFKLLISKSRKLINNFNKFYNLSLNDLNYSNQNLYKNTIKI